MDFDYSATPRSRATGGVAAQLVVPPVRAGTAPTRWEYQCALVEGSYGTEVTPTLNKLGAEGWELVSMAPQDRIFEGIGGVLGFMLCAKRALGLLALKGYCVRAQLDQPHDCCHSADPGAAAPLFGAAAPFSTREAPKVQSHCSPADGRLPSRIAAPCARRRPFDCAHVGPEVRSAPAVAHRAPQE
jgi:hypothetical protein